MTRVYVPRPIRTVEDAEGLPVGSIALLDETPEAWKCGCVDYDTTPPTHGVWHASAAGRELPPNWWIGCVALVPVEAEEQKIFAHAVRDDMPPGSMMRRFVTPWEPAPDREQP